MFLARSSVMISKRFDAYHEVPIKHGPQMIVCFYTTCWLFKFNLAGFSEAYSKQGPKEDVHSKIGARPEGTYIFMWMHIQ